jgi:Type VI secretion system/phage-baseplate injector OB domain
VPHSSDSRTKTLGDLGYREEFKLFPGREGEAPDPDPPVSQRHYGKYRGTVVNNVDPYQQGRLLVSVPGILITNWAMPCVPVTDVLMGTFARPRIGANVWVEFERGDPDKPIWVGCYWGKGEVPALAKAAYAVPPTNTVITVETASSGLSISDVPLAGANVFIRSPIGSIAMTPAGIILTAPSVSVNAAMFKVTTPTGAFTVV